MAIRVNVLSRVLKGDSWKVTVEIDGVQHSLRVRDDADLDRQVLAISAAAGRIVTVGARDVDVPAPITPKAPTQEEIDAAAFAVLVKEYRAIKAQVDAGVGKVSQADVDAKIVEIKTAYKDEYAPMLVGVF